MDINHKTDTITPTSEGQITVIGGMNAHFYNLYGTPYGLVPQGGTEGQVLAKVTTDNFDTHWVDAPTGGGGSSGPTLIALASQYEVLSGDIYPVTDMTVTIEEGKGYFIDLQGIIEGGTAKLTFIFTSGGTGSSVLGNYNYGTLATGYQGISDPSSVTPADVTFFQATLVSGRWFVSPGDGGTLQLHATSVPGSTLYLHGGGQTILRVEEVYG